MGIIEQIEKEPVAFQGLLQAILATLVGFHVLKLTTDQVGLLWGLTAALLSFLTRQVVTAIANPKLGDGTALVPKK